MTEEYRLDLATLEADICGGAVERAPRPRWLERSYREPEEFWRALQRSHAQRLATPSRATLFERYDFFHDACVRHVRAKNDALCWYDATSTLRSVDYMQLATRAGRRAQKWRHAGVEPGVTIAIVEPLGLELATSLLAALKLGAVISLVPPQGRTLAAMRMEALAPDFLDTEPAFATLIPDGLNLLPREGAGEELETDLDRSHAYGSGELVGRLFDPTQAELFEPVELRADAAYLCPLRDGALALSVGPGSRFAAPGFDLLECQPALLLSGWLNGATYVLLSERDVEGQPNLLVADTYRAVGVTDRVRRALEGAGVDIGESWRAWWRNPVASRNLGLWMGFVQATGLSRTWCSNIKIDAASGGCSLFSVRRPGTPHQEAWPSGGVPWTLGGVLPGDEESLSDYGVLRLAPISGGEEGEVAYRSANVLVRSQRSHVAARSVAVGRGGHVYPLEPLSAALAGVRGCKAATAALVPMVGGDLEPEIAVVAFVGASGDADASEVQAAIYRTVTNELGDAFAPDRVHVLPLYPRRGEDGAADLSWCREQYLGGRLVAQSRDEVFALLSQLRQTVAPYVVPE